MSQYKYKTVQINLQSSEDHFLKDIPKILSEQRNFWNFQEKVLRVDDITLHTSYYNLLQHKLLRSSAYILLLI
jgi:hypothetical protein